MSIDVVAGITFRWKGVVYAAGDPVDVTGWANHEIGKLLVHAPVYIAGSTTGGFYTDEQVRDVIAAALVAGAGMDIDVDDGGDTITINGPGAAAFSYVHDQASALATWTINHGLGYVPGGVMVVDSAGSAVEGAVNVIDDDTIEIEFNAAFTGKAYLS